MEKSSASFVLLLGFLFASIGASMYVGGQSFSITTLPNNANNSNYEVESETVSYYGDAQGYLVTPSSNDTVANATRSAGEQQQELPAVVVIHEWWGINDNIKKTADALAKEGYVVLSADLYNGEVTADTNRARELSLSVRNNPEQAIANLQSAVQYLGSLPNVNSSRIASLGWAFGGGQSLQLALNSEQNPLVASVIYYGNLVNDIDSLSKINWPVLGIFGAQDQSISVEAVNTFERALNQTGIPSEIYIYPGVGHGFASPEGDSYVQETATDAWNKTIAFLDKHVSAKNDSSIKIQEVLPNSIINNETQVLVNDVIKDLHLNDTNSAIVHLKLVQQHISHIAGNSSTVELAKILVSDTLEDLENGDIGSALSHMNLANQQLVADLPTTVQGNRTTTPKASIITEEQLSTKIQALDEDAQDSYNLTVGNKTFSTKYQIINATLNNIIPIANQASLLLNISSNKDGTLTIDLPRELIDSKGSNEADEEFVVFADGQQTAAAEITEDDNQSRTQSIDFENGVEQIEIVGTQMAASPPTTDVIQTNQTSEVDKATLSRMEENKTQSQSQPVNFLTFDSIAPDVKIKYPSDWISGGPNVSEPITIINSFYSPESEVFAQVFVGIDYTYRAHSKLNDFLSEAISSYTMYPEYYPDFRLDYSSTDNATLAGGRAYMLEGRYNDPELGIQKVMDIGTIIGNRGYFVQYIASPSMYSHYLPTVQTMLDSVQITSSTTGASKAQSQSTKDQEAAPLPEPIPSEPQSTSVNVHLDTHIYTIRDQPVKIRIWNPEQSDYQWESLTVPSSGGITESFAVSNDFIPEGNGFMVCVTNERNDKEDCRQTVRERGSSQTDVFITVP